MKHTARIVFGKEQVNKYLANSEFSVEDQDLNIKSYSFDSESELNAFLKGVNDTVGWTEVYQIENKIKQ